MKSINIIFGLALVLGIFATAADAQNYRLKQTTSMNGQKSESTIYVRGQRKRTEGGGYMGMGGDVADVEQCDLKQNLKISDKKKMYAVEPFDTGSNDAPATATKTPTTPRPKSASTRGGVVTYVSNSTDTGERKQIFGMTARHIKTSMSMEASPDACSKQDMSMESDGWYIDLPEFSCPFTMKPQTPQMPTEAGGCRDEIRSRSTGSGKLGFALMETRNISMGGGMTFTMSTETIEFSKATLDAALFDIPQGYARTENSQELYGKPDLSALMRAAQSGGGEDEEKPKSKPSSSTPASTMPMQTEMPDAKKPGSIRIGVLPPTNRGGESISITNMQSFLAQKLTTGNVEGIAVGSEADARSAGCDYLLTSDFSKLKQSTAAKIGGMFGKITNTGVNGGYDTQVDYTLTSLKSGQVKLQNKAMSKTETNVDRAAESVLEIEAGAIVIAAIKN